MLGEGGQTPSRSELLCMVKKNSKMLGKTIVEDERSDVETDPRFWHGVMDVYFIRGRESRGRQEDDLVFFVKKLHLQKHGSNEDESANTPYFVRRWAPKLDDLIGASASDVDWRRSFYLNLIAQTSFSVTVAICSQQVLQNYQTGKDRPLSPIYKASRQIKNFLLVFILL
uniref:Cw7 protein n=1 Tax=Solanum tuberosum TaxID=4113 RepID=M1A1F7_SOLTU